MSDRLRISNTWGKRFTDQKIALPALLRRAGLPIGLFEQEKVYLTTDQLFALWRSVGETSSDPAVGLKLGSETRLARSHPAGIAVICSRTFEDALQRLARYKQLTCPEEIRVDHGAQEAQPSSDLTDSLLHLCRMATALEKCTADVAVAKAVERKFSTVDNLQQFCVLRTPRIQGAVTATVSHHRFADLFSTA